MSRKHSHPARGGKPPKADDLKLIIGIGPAVEARLHGVGIFTFAQLASLSPADIAASVVGLTGLTAERIIKQDWIGQASKLATRSAEEFLVEEEAIEVEMQLDGESSEAIVEVVDLLDTTAQAEAIERDVEEAEAKADEQLPPVVEAEPMPTPTPALSGILHLRELEMATPGEYEQHNMLSSGQPFEASLTLDLADVVAPGNSALAYTASIYGKSLDRPARSLLGEAQGSLILSDRAAIKVQGIAPPQGLYRLWAIVTLAPPAGTHAQRPVLTAHMEERLLQCG